MKVKWHPKVKISVRQTASYIRSRFDAKSASNFIKEVSSIENLLMNNPQLGAVDP